MLVVHAAPPHPTRVVGATTPGAAVWFDLLDPTPQEIAHVEAETGLDLPSREDMQEIEVSSRLAQQGDALLMTATVMSKADSDTPEASAITFLVAPAALVTLRYSDPKPFATFRQRLQRNPALAANSDLVFVALMETIVDRIADVLESISTEIDALARDVFDRSDEAAGSEALEEALQRIGRAGTMLSTLSESIVGLGRAVAFFGSAAAPWLHKETKHHLKPIGRDLKSLNDQVGFLSHKTNFLLDATLGLISIEQNRIIKIFTIAAVTFMPPTLIASIYGMNFAAMPELQWVMGYPMAVALMVLAAALPLVWFRRQGWL
ncbi:MAG: magnesium and cobalt transport protein CorA [Alphaproteobacteria bacterium]|nr:magnesium/cobalt transporter CorA [Alphaproteobacteria bacterium]TAD91183.1 MAG: magnesium and cobalt transport protein CorA [Alphaproteobacteria bacterium]